MMWARSESGRVVEVTDVDPAGRFNSALQWEACPAGTAIGDHWDGASFSKPVAPTATLADRRAALAAERYARENAGIQFQAAGAAAPSLAASDALSQAKMTSSYLAATAGHWIDGTPWKMADGSFVPLAAADMQALALKLLAYVAACYAHEAALSAALAVDPATDITQGWPVTL